MSDLDANFFRPFVEGTRHTLQVACRIEATPGQPVVKLRGLRSELRSDIAGVIAIVSPGFTGSIALCFPEAVFVALMGNMLGEAYAKITDELADGAAELLNMIFGYAKVALNERGHAIQKALPTVIRGSGMSVAGGNSRTVILPFLTEVGKFHIEIQTE